MVTHRHVSGMAICTEIKMCEISWIKITFKDIQIMGCVGGTKKRVSKSIKYYITCGAYGLNTHIHVLPNLLS